MSGPITPGATAPNAHRLLWAGFMAILAAGVGFAIRGGILDNWGREFGFTGAELGAIGGAGFTGFCFGIIIGGVIADKIGYGKLVGVAFLLHVLSAVVTFAAAAPVAGADTAALAAAKAAGYGYLFWGTFLFAVANGTLEAVANPLVATAFPNNRTHYLNILHASWPAGMILGGVAGWVLDDQIELHWKYQLALFLVPTVIYGLMFIGQAMPKSEASKMGLSLGDMLKDVGLLGGLIVCFLLSLFLRDVLSPLFPNNPEMGKYAGYGVGAVLLLGLAALTKGSMGSPLLFVLFVVHALVGAVELGTDGWIQNITGNILSSGEGKILFVFTSAVMFALRFCADFIEKKLGFSPIGILLTCAILACVGLNLTSKVDSFALALVALTVYGVGKTFFWPTMLAVASDRFPRTGAVAISIMGGIGMLSAGLMGAPGLGYSKDRFAGEALKSTAPALFEEYKASKPSGFLFLPEATGLDGTKVGDLQKIDKAQRTPEQQKVIDASIAGDRKTLVADSFIPATMAVIYLLLLLYFKSIGGYKAISLAEVHSGTDLGTAES
ncbi:MAG: MFS transporter [Planctomycetaceae bacterium]|nr:MFS transporter [Planctomycetaceae bacterium]